jgi:hypothetical protein
MAMDSEQCLSGMVLKYADRSNFNTSKISRRPYAEIRAQD